MSKYSEKKKKAREYLVAPKRKKLDINTRLEIVKIEVSIYTRELQKMAFILKKLQKLQLSIEQRIKDDQGQT